jgi:hypothetical protein
MAREVILSKVNLDITPRKIYEASVYSPGNTPAEEDLIKASLERWGVECSELRDGKATFLEIQQEVNANRPIIVGFRGLGTGHVVVIGGYEMRGPTRWCKVYDPADNSEQTMPYRAIENHNPPWRVTFFLRERVVAV